VAGPRRALGLAAVLLALALLASGCALQPTPASPPAPVPLRLLAFNDFHGHLLADEAGTVEVADPRDGALRRIRAGGAAHLAALIAQRRAEAAHALVLSTGDLVGASPLTSALFRDEPTIEVMNLIGIDANVVGNHEFDKGFTELQRLIRGGCASSTPESPLGSCAGPDGPYPGARFPMLGANVLDAAGQPVLPPVLVRRIGPVAVGVIGAVTRTTPSIVSPSGVSGLRFEDEAQAINRQVRALREQGVEAIIALIHEGGSAQAGPGQEGDCSQARGEIFGIIDRLDPAVDVVLSGHTHQVYNCVRRGIRVIQGGSYGRLVSEVDLLLDPVSRDVIKDSVRAVNRPVANGLDTNPAARGGIAAVPADAAVAARVAYYAALAAPRRAREVGRLLAPATLQPSAGGDSSAGRLVADAQLAATRGAADGGARLALMNPGGVRAELRPRGTDGVVSYGDAFAMQPFGNSLVTMSLSGAQLLALLEQQWIGVNRERPRLLQPSAGFEYAWNPNAPPGARVVPGSARLDGEPLVPERLYRVTVNSFLADGGDGFSVLAEGRERLGGVQDLDALLAWLRVRSPLAPDAVSRIRRQD
jgi:5'-nucleotidase